MTGYSENSRRKRTLCTAFLLCTVLLLAVTQPGAGASAEYAQYFETYRNTYGGVSPAAGSFQTMPENGPGFTPGRNAEGDPVFVLPVELKGRLEQIYLNLYLAGNGVFYQMGYDFFTDYLDKDGNLLQDFDGIWYTLNGYTSPFYITQMMVDSAGRIVKTGTVPVLLNGHISDLIVYDEDYDPVISGVRLYGSDQVIPISSLGPDDSFTMIAGYTTPEGEWVGEYPVSPAIYPSKGLDFRYDYLPNRSNAVAFYMIVDADGSSHSTDALD